VWLALWAGLNAVYVSGDLFNTYVALELVGLSAVGLVALGGRDPSPPALRYLFVAVLGSLAYLLGVALVYAEAGTLDIARQGSARRRGGRRHGLAAMALGLSLKTALFPLHAWLPEAHSRPPRRSARCCRPWS
jgi:multicomponent Na+:H+ antiporter subunit D